MTKTTTPFYPVLIVEYDDFAYGNSPSEWGNFRLYSFNTSHRSFTHPDDIDDLDDLLASGVARRVSYYEHGLCRWYRPSDLRAAGLPHRRWDNVDFAGVVIREYGDGPIEDDELDRFLELYTDWANGHVYRFTIAHRDPVTGDYEYEYDGDLLPSYGDVYLTGMDADEPATEILREVSHLLDGVEHLTIDGDAAGLLDADSAALLASVR